MRIKTRTAQLQPEAVAQFRSRQAIKWSRRVPRIKNKDLREHPLDRARIDVALIGDVPVRAKSVPIADEEMAVTMFHMRSLRRRMCLFAPLRSLHSPVTDQRAKAVPARVQRAQGSRRTRPN